MKKILLGIICSMSFLGACSNEQAPKSYSVSDQIDQAAEKSYVDEMNGQIKDLTKAVQQINHVLNDSPNVDEKDLQTAVSWLGPNLDSIIEYSGDVPKRYKDDNQKLKDAAQDYYFLVLWLDKSIVNEDYDRLKQCTDKMDEANRIIADVEQDFKTN